MDLRVVPARPAGRPRGTAARRRLRRALTGLVREVFALSAKPQRAVRELNRPTLARGLRVITYSLLAAYLVALGAAVVSDRVRGGVVVVAVLAALPAAPVMVLLVRPVAAWWLSLIFAVPYIVLVGRSTDPALADVPWPWTEAGTVAHLIVSLVVAYQVAPRVFLTQWLITVLLAAAVEWAFPHREQLNNGVVLGGLYAAGLAVVALLRWLRDVRRELRHQVTLTERERTRRTVLEERTRIARELHDVVAHHMSLIAVQAEAAPYRVSELEPEAAESFTRIRENALAAMKEMRHILGMLRSDDDGGSQSEYAPQPTLADLDGLFDNVRGADLSLRTDIRGDVRPLPPQTELMAFRMIQEALSNAVRHAPGAEVEVEVTFGRRMLDLRVSNSPSRVTTVAQGRRDGVGHGLTGMRERASVVGATLRVGRRPDGWYEVAASLPLQEDVHR